MKLSTLRDISYDNATTVDLTGVYRCKFCGLKSRTTENTFGAVLHFEVLTHTSQNLHIK